MVARITFPKKVQAALNYNEKKVQQGKAACLAACGYLREAGKMNFYQKLAGLENRNLLNDRTTTNTVHISLNFDPAERLADKKLIEIVNAYMKSIGFSEQPFLVYRHEDAGHPHIHIVSTTIRDDGGRINTHNIGKTVSEKARKEIESTFGLVKAERQRSVTTSAAAAVAVQKAVYGKGETKHAISNVVGLVFRKYKFTSLPEYNAALHQFNVNADKGEEGGRINRYGGLVYRLLDSEGKKIGVPIKASAINSQPTLKNLQSRFVANETAREPFKKEVVAALDICLQKAGSIATLTEALKAQNIYTLIRRNDAGKMYGITYVDNRTACVFNGSDLGKAYSAAAIQSLLGQKPNENTIRRDENSSATAHGGHAIRPTVRTGKSLADEKEKAESVLSGLLSTKEQHDNIPGSLLNKKRKKKKRRDTNF